MMVKIIVLVFCFLIISPINSYPSQDCMPESLIIDGYRLYYGEDKVVDWVDICCTYDNNFIKIYEDMSPIQEVQCIDNCFYIFKKYSTWRLCNFYNLNKMYLDRIN